MCLGSGRVVAHATRSVPLDWNAHRRSEAGERTTPDRINPPDPIVGEDGQPIPEMAPPCIFGLCSVA